jgi:hypothetical protein
VRHLYLPGPRRGAFRAPLKTTFGAAPQASLKPPGRHFNGRATPVFRRFPASGQAAARRSHLCAADHVVGQGCQQAARTVANEAYEACVRAAHLSFDDGEDMLLSDACARFHGVRAFLRLVERPASDALLVYPAFHFELRESLPHRRPAVGAVAVQDFAPIAFIKQFVNRLRVVQGGG